MMKSENLRLGMTLKMDKDAPMRPQSVQFWTDPENYKAHPPKKPLHFLADAILALATIELNTYLRSPLMMKSFNLEFAHLAWETLDPHLTLFEKSHTRMRAIQKDLEEIAGEPINQFQKQFSKVLNESQTQTGFSFTKLTQLISVMDQLEDDLGEPILFHFGLKFNEAFRKTLLQVFSLLHHLRVVVATHYNENLQDTTLQALKVDSITDYLPKADYLVNDALLFWQFKKLTTPLANNTNHEFVNRVLVAPLEKNFRKYLNNACSLVDHLPPTFLDSMNPLEMEDSLYLLKMDWLLGSDSGLLFRIREELYGIQSGYSQLFWADTDLIPDQVPDRLNISINLRKSSVFGDKAV